MSRAITNALAPAAQWWASSRRSARGALLGAVTLVASLATVTGVIWVSPGSPAQRVDRVVADITGVQRLTGERNQLLSDSVSSRKKLDEANGKVARAASREEALRAQIASLKGQVQSARAELADAKAAAKSAGSGSSRSAGAKNPSGTGSPGSATPAAPAPIVTPTREQLIQPASPYFGLYTAQSPFNWAEYDATAKKVGATPNLAGFFSGWDEDFRASGVTRAWKHGALPLVTWESRPIGSANDQKEEPDYTLSSIIGGSHDAYITQFAQDVVATGLPFVLRFDHEMNGDWYPWAEGVNTNTQGQYVQAWRHVHDIFEREGANRFAIWNWAPNRIDKLAADRRGLDYLRSLYPGDEYVDWVGMSGYLRPPFKANQEIGFDQTFGATLTQLRQVAPGKRILLAEVGASEVEGHKPDWLASFFRGLDDPANADIVGFSWFSLTVSSKVDGVLATNDWRVDSTAASIAAFKAGLNAPGGRFSGGG
ncbi:glycoside hydrolase family 26 protein [Schumannella soli]|uniref:GH26 domain-containing protein n=1 Tax=Schumannella soli TaxID=2590779 RepID=A0A506Y2L2_9MICO|nr:glycosyl hydrolase [Schumannella soli]TPW76153.1 hypothetical protein FJ657_10095 [Schumannella soli]